MYGLEQSTAKYFQLTGNVFTTDMEKFINSIKGKIEYIGFVKGREDANYLKYTKEVEVHTKIIYNHLLIHGVSNELPF
jgi:hypothetical protein